jgi:hypothetical protein
MPMCNKPQRMIDKPRGMSSRWWDHRQPLTGHLACSGASARTCGCSHGLASRLNADFRYRQTRWVNDGGSRTCHRRQHGLLSPVCLSVWGLRAAPTLPSRQLRPTEFADKASVTLYTREFRSPNQHHATLLEAPSTCGPCLVLLTKLCAKCDQAKSSDHASCEVLRAPISRGAERPGRVRQGLRSWFMKHVMRLLLVTTLSLAGLTGLAPWRSSDG